MRHTPRNLRLALALLLACAAHGPAARAQGKSAARGTRPTDARDAKARASAERLGRKAVAVLHEVAAGAKAVEDPSERASVLTLCADALWGADEQAARDAFGRAWEAAVESDEADLKDEQENGRYGDLPERFTRARDQVLASAARRDAGMAEAWLGALADWLAARESSAGGEGAPRDDASRDAGPLNEFTRDGQRLALASSLIDEEAYDSAARVAAPALKGGVSGPLVELLLALRAGAPEEADRLYLQLLSAARANPNADANDVLILSSYALTPSLLAVVGGDGSVRFRALGGPPDPVTGGVSSTVVSARAREAFFDAAAAILLRPPLNPQAAGADAAAIYFAAGRLLPFFESGAPRHAPALRARLSELAAALDAARRAALESQMKTRNLWPANPSDPLRAPLELVERAGDPTLRDDARLRAVETAAKMRLWERARRVADEVEDPGRRRAARSLVDAYAVAYVGEAFSDEDDDFERAAALVRAADVRPALRAYGLARAAEFAARRGKRARAAALLEEALDQAAQADAGNSLRDAAWLAAATAAARVGSPRLWYALAGAVASFNEDEQFEGGRIWFNLEERVSFSHGEAGALDEAFRPYDVGVMFEAAARRDFERAAAEARNLRSQGARARALVAAARATLDQAAGRSAAAGPAR